MGVFDACCNFRLSLKLQELGLPAAVIFALRCWSVPVVNHPKSHFGCRVARPVVSSICVLLWNLMKNPKTLELKTFGRFRHHFFFKHLNAAWNVAQLQLLALVRAALRFQSLNVSSLSEISPFWSDKQWIKPGYLDYDLGYHTLLFSRD